MLTVILIIVGVIIGVIILLFVIVAIAGSDMGKVKCPYCKEMIVPPNVKLPSGFVGGVHEFKCPKCRKLISKIM